MAPFYKAVNVQANEKTLEKGVYVGDIDSEWLVTA